jgi:hypothetical protein
MTPEQALETSLQALFSVALGATVDPEEKARADAVLASPEGLAYTARTAESVALTVYTYPESPAGRKTCGKCAGAGVLHQYRHRSGGVCYRCYGAGSV